MKVAVLGAAGGSELTDLPHPLPAQRVPGLLEHLRLRSGRDHEADLSGKDVTVEY